MLNIIIGFFAVVAGAAAMETGIRQVRARRNAPREFRDGEPVCRKCGLPLRWHSQAQVN